MVGYGCYEGRNWKHGGAVNLEERRANWENGREGGQITLRIFEKP